MAIVTTKNLTNPKPVRGLDYAGNPIPDGGYYNGRPEHQGADEGRQDAPRTSVNRPMTRRKRRRLSLSPEQRQAFGDRMRAYWAKRKAGTVDSQSTVSPSVDT